MFSARLSLALADGHVDLPETGLVVWGARAEIDLSLLPRSAHLVGTFRPDFEALSVAGWQVETSAPDSAAAALVIVPREKRLARAYLAEAARISTGPVVVDGQKSDGIEGLLRDLKTRGALTPALSKSHGKLAVLAPGADLTDWIDPGPESISDGFVTRVGVFSADGPDPGSQLLADALPARLGPRVADLGAGWGYLSRAILSRDGVEDLHLIEADLHALDCARLNVTDARAQFHWADATRFQAEPFDTIVTNPPFHTSRQADPGLGRAFLATAARLLRPKGQLWLVANRQLPYERSLAEAFGEVAEVGGDTRYKLFRALRPRKQGNHA